MVIWDDHESANNSWRNGAENHTDGNEGPWPARKSASMQAYLEWLPLRQKEPLFPEEIFRNLNYGDLCDLFFLDTRLHGRDEQMGTTGTQVNSPSRTLLGADQFEWFTDGIKNSTAQWKVVVQQVMISPLAIAGIAVNEDQWDGYPAERQNIFDTITAHGISNFVVLTGDIHTAWANDIPGPSYNAATNSGAMGVEFVAPGITSPSELTFGAPAILAANDHMQYVNLTQNGFIILDINKDRTQADWYFLSTIDEMDATALVGASYLANDGEAFLTPAAGVSVAHPTSMGQQVPEQKRDCFAIGIEENEKNPVLLSVYPNPISNWFTLQFYMEKSSKVATSIAVKPSFGLADDEITKMLTDSMANAEQDMQARMLKEQQVEAKRVLESVQAALAADGDLLSEQERNDISNALFQLVEITQNSDQNPTGIKDIEVAIEKVDNLTAYFAELRMDTSIRQALSGQKVDDI